jgi:predicted dinucleotide-binding enzyme
MRYGVVGTGMVGQTLGTKLVGLGHDVMMGSRSAQNEKARAWLAAVGGRARASTFADAARHGEILVNCTQGTVSLDVLRSVDRGDLAGKVLIDVANPLDFSTGSLTLSICNTDSLGESIQREFPELRVVKTLNTCNCQVMVNPDRVRGEHDVFVCGNDAAAKETVTALLRDFGWRSIIDVGNIIAARATEQLLPIWVNLYGLYGTADFNFRIVRG